MSYINNKKLLEIRAAARNGNEKAQMVLQALRKGDAQDSLDRLVQDYYGFQEQQTYGEPTPPVQETIKETQIDAPVEDPVDNVSEQDIPAQEQTEIEPQLDEADGLGVEQPSDTIAPELQPEESSELNQVDVEDLTDILDGETVDLFDENEIDDVSFVDFLSNKKKDGIRAKKNAEYFKAYNPDSRAAYMTKKIDAYKGKFDDRLKDIDRRYNDIGKSIDLYSTKANEMLDDDMEMDMDKAGSAYSDFVTNDKLMHSFGRHWDDADNNAIIDELHALMGKYGKKNVIAALNSLKNDNEGYKGFLGNQIDTEINRYSKIVENLLK